jgi:hypothetical protein
VNLMKLHLPSWLASDPLAVYATVVATAALAWQLVAWSYANRERLQVKLAEGEYPLVMKGIPTACCGWR